MLQYFLQNLIILFDNLMLKSHLVTLYFILFIHSFDHWKKWSVCSELNLLFKKSQELGLYRSHIGFWCDLQVSLWVFDLLGSTICFRHYMNILPLKKWTWLSNYVTLHYLFSLVLIGYVDCWRNGRGNRPPATFLWTDNRLFYWERYSLMENRSWDHVVLPHQLQINNWSFLHFLYPYIAISLRLLN